VRVALVVSDRSRWLEGTVKVTLCTLGFDNGASVSDPAGKKLKTTRRRCKLEFLWRCRCGVDCASKTSPTGPKTASDRFTLAERDVVVIDLDYSVRRCKRSSAPAYRLYSWVG